MKDLPSRYNPSEVEDAIYRRWMDSGYFHADTKTAKDPYTIMIPPPNVTGILHMGHALNNTIQDILIRVRRMQGYEALWMPGTDHAGIATQNVVERKLKAEGRSREDLGREKFIEEVWKWREEYGSTIIGQLKKLGASCDWERTRFTMDSGLSDAVQTVFVSLFKKGLIYQGSYIINWCPRCCTALSDEEAPHRDMEGAFYYVKYPVKGSSETVTIATTRPETMLGDVAVCVNPSDKRYAAIHGKTIVLPLIGRELKVILDEAVDPEFGTGALKVTPAHDPVDFELGKKHGLESVNVMTDQGVINDNGGQYSGMDRFDARRKVIEDLTEKGLFVKKEKHNHSVGHCYRCDTVIEPRLSKQWFVKMKPLAEPAIAAVNREEIRFYPQRWTKVYLNWMENIRDWCISRQIWWGHRIPAWYCAECNNLKDRGSGESPVPEKNNPVVSVEKPASCSVCGCSEFVRDPDVLDTWFSSWLWPFSTLGWPEETEELKRFYPTDTLVTASEIIFFWVARMIMSGLEFMKKVPFKDVYIHGTVRDDTGKKMSKSLGNIIDPLDVIKEFGADALRFSIISITAQGQDVYLSKEKFHLGRNFANKIWNASRFILMNLSGKDLPVKFGDIDKEKLSYADKWILANYFKSLAQINEAIDRFKISEAANIAYDFFWHVLCDWFLEIAKLDEFKDESERVLYYVFYNSLKLLHPFLPFITDHIWKLLPIREEDSVMVSSWPSPEDFSGLNEEAAGMQLIIDIVSAVRNCRSEWNVNPKKNLKISVSYKDISVKQSIDSLGFIIKSLAGSG